MIKAILAAAAIAAAIPAAAVAAPALPAAPVIGACDPALQDYAETAYGYLSAGAGLRDSVISAAPGGELLLVSVRGRTGNAAALLSELEAAAGFVLKAERSRLSGGRRVLTLVGWVRASSLAALRASPGAALVRVLE